MQWPPPDESRMSTSGVLVRAATARFLPDLKQNSPHGDPAIDFPLLWRSYKQQLAAVVAAATPTVLQVIDP